MRGYGRPGTNRSAGTRTCDTASDATTSRPIERRPPPVKLVGTCGRNSAAAAITESQIDTTGPTVTTSTNRANRCVARRSFTDPTVVVVDVAGRPSPATPTSHFARPVPLWHRRRHTLGWSLAARTGENILFNVIAEGSPVADPTGGPVELLAADRLQLDRVSTAERVADVLRTRITVGDLPPGTRLSEEAIGAA